MSFQQAPNALRRATMPARHRRAIEAIEKLPIEKLPFADDTLPSIAPGECLVNITYLVCAPSTLAVRFLGWHPGVAPAVDDGVPVDGWWRIESAALPDRFVRLLDGRRSVQRLVFHQGLQDERECTNIGRGVLECAPLADATAMPPYAPDGASASPLRDPYLLELTSVRQRKENSGLCWWGSSMLALLLNHEMREGVVIPALPGELRAHARACLFDDEASETLRRGLWERFHFGDPWPQTIEHPELDGQNGMTQLLVLLAQLDVPTRCSFVEASGEATPVRAVRDVRGREHDLRPDADDAEHHVLVVRFHGGDGVPAAPARWMEHGGRQYNLVAMLIGSDPETGCGHQVAHATPDTSSGHWVMACVDQRFYGICPTHWRAGEALPQAEWWRLSGVLAAATRYDGDRLCTLGPVRDTALDLLYLSPPHCRPRPPPAR